MINSNNEIGNTHAGRDVNSSNLMLYWIIIIILKYKYELENTYWVCYFCFSIAVLIVAVIGIGAYYFSENYEISFTKKM